MIMLEKFRGVREPYVGGGAFGYVQVGQIYQKFECKDRSDGGVIRNVVRWSIENLLEVSFQMFMCCESSLWTVKLAKQQKYGTNVK